MLQLDSFKIEAGGLDQALAVELGGVISERIRPRFVRGTTMEHLLAQLAALDGERFRAIAVVAHSNADGVQVAPNWFTPWSAFTGYLERFAPERIALIACGAGQRVPIGALFSALPTLKSILASPVLVTKHQATVMSVLLPVLVGSRTPDPKGLLALKLALIALDGSQLWLWTRAEWRRGKPIEAGLMDVLAGVADPLLRRLAASLRQ